VRLEQSLAVVHLEAVHWKGGVTAAETICVG